MTNPLSRDQDILVERAALQLFGTHTPISHVCAVLRGLGLPPVQAAPLFSAIEARIADFEAGRFTQLTHDAVGATAVAQRTMDGWAEATGDRFAEGPVIFGWDIASDEDEHRAFLEFWFSPSATDDDWAPEQRDLLDDMLAGKVGLSEPTERVDGSRGWGD